MDYKVNFLIGESQSRPGYVELNATHIRDLNGVLEDGECTEIIALDTVDFFPHDKRGDFLNHLMQKLELGKIMKVGGRELNAVANATVLGQINDEQFNIALYGGGRQSVTTCAATRNLLQFLGMEIVQSYYNNFNYVVEARALFEYDLVIYYGEGNTDEELKDTMRDEHHWAHLQPQRIVFIEDENHPSKELVKIYTNGSSIPITRVKVFDCKSVLEAFNYGITHIKSKYVLLTVAGAKMDWLWLSKLKELTEKQKVLMVEPTDEGFALVVLTQLYKDVGGTSETTVIDKIRTLAAEQEVSQYIYKNDLGGERGITEGNDSNQ